MEHSSALVPFLTGIDEAPVYRRTRPSTEGHYQFRSVRWTLSFFSWVLKQLKLSRDMQKFIYNNYLRHSVFRERTLQMRIERQNMAKLFAFPDARERVMICLRIETRLLELETGDLEIEYIKRAPISHHVSHEEEEDEYCYHSRMWARVKRPEISFPSSRYLRKRLRESECQSP